LFSCTCFGILNHFLSPSPPHSYFSHLPPHPTSPLLLFYSSLSSSPRLLYFSSHSSCSPSYTLPTLFIYLFSLFFFYFSRFALTLNFFHYLVSTSISLIFLCLISLCLILRIFLLIHPPWLLYLSPRLPFPPKGKRKAIPVTGRKGPHNSEVSRLPHFLDNRLTDGGEVVSLTCPPPFTTTEIASIQDGP
jgi:hypothetical protein